MAEQTKLFGTDGIRGRVNEFPITATVALRMGMAVAGVLGDGGSGRRRVLIGRDTRGSGPMLEGALASGLVAMGVDVVVCGALPTPAVAHLTRTMGFAAGVMITASHNPFEDNGIKVFGPDGYKLSDELEAEVERRILADGEPGLADAAGLGKTADLREAAGRYIEFVKQSAGGVSLAGMKVVLDCGNGAAFEVGPVIFRELGAEVLVAGDRPDGVNINRDCGALHAERIADLVRESGADAGISLDGDADRVIFTDETGEVVSGDRVLGMCAVGLKERGELAGDTLVATVMSNLGLTEAMGRHGIGVVATAVGDRNVIERMRADGFVFGGENSGHLIFGAKSTTGDGLMSALQVLRMMREKGVTLSEMSAVFEEYPSVLRNLAVVSKPPLDSLPRLQALMREAEEAFGGAGRHLIRYSGTERKIRVLVEHKDATACDEWVARFEQVIGEEIGLA